MERVSKSDLKRVIEGSKLISSLPLEADLKRDLTFKICELRQARSGGSTEYVLEAACDWLRTKGVRAV